MEPVQLLLANGTQALLSSAPIVGFESGPSCLMAERKSAHFVPLNLLRPKNSWTPVLFQFEGIRILIQWMFKE